jgi:hypothetical protein
MSTTAVWTPLGRGMHGTAVPNMAATDAANTYTIHIMHA